MRWGFLGVGRVTPRMVTAIRSCGSIESVAARDSEKLTAWAKQFSVSHMSTDFNALIESSKVDAIYIALPPALHHTMASAALRAGKVVLCEKPLALDFEQASSLQSLSEETRTPLYHATAFPFHPRSHAMREVVRSGRLGKLSRVSIACTFSHVLNRGKDYRTETSLGGGCLLDLGWYCVYATLWMTGLKPKSIRAFGRRMNSDGVWISAQAIVELEQDVTAVLDCGFDAAGRKWMELGGDQASIICDDFLRPWDLEKPRFWLHGHDGKAQVELVGEGTQQEEIMVREIQASANRDAIDSLNLAVETQRILGAWNLAMESGTSQSL